ncbi:alpha/beta hydrolase [Zoogloea sp.]|uniref:alpha/beta fold hydrolase n=1 Tax=Zoogloea sp. TaxID=49181 RepID=UPI00262F8D20|nr:alpha/beta hydrolase [Zoogloea sp.]MDD3352924.1 alpha/beta hydrolase [Zoogloea sp.]
MTASTPRWIETGHGQRGLLFLHGVSGGAAGALDLLPALTPPGWRGLAWDMPGYGTSAPIRSLDFNLLADALIALLDAAGLDQAVLVGHSMGGMVALQVAARFPNRVSGLVLACCTPAFGAASGPLQQAFLERRLGPLDEGASMRELAIELIPGMVGPGGDPQVVADAVDLMAEIPPDSYRTAMEALVAFDQRAALPGLTMPTLVLAGVHDRVSVPQVVRRMAERIPAATYRELEAGHLAPFEEPEAFAAEVRRFLQGLDHAPVTFLL